MITGSSCRKSRNIICSNKSMNFRTLKKFHRQNDEILFKKEIYDILVLCSLLDRLSQYSQAAENYGLKMIFTYFLLFCLRILYHIVCYIV